MMILIKGGQVFDGKNGFYRRDVLVDGDTVIDIKESISCKSSEVIDANDRYILPGFIDIHTHGVNGNDTMNSTYKALDDMSLFYASRGVTSFLPTTMTAPVMKIVSALENVKDAIQKGTRGAKILGINLEGPFVSRKYKGSQPEEYIMYPSIELIGRFIEKSGDNIRIITLAPELEGAAEAIEYFKDSRITFAAGHSELNYNRAKDVFSGSVKHVTHLFNAMMGIHHREPGLTGAAVDNEEVSVEIIADGIHINPAVVRMVVKCKTPDKVVLITDSTMAAGLPDGEYSLGEQRIIVRKGEARLENGVLSGSTLTMVDAVRNMVNSFGIPLGDAVKMATVTPAKVIGVDNKKGSIAVNKDADILILDKNLNVKMTMVEGCIVYKV